MILVFRCRKWVILLKLDSKAVKGLSLVTQFGLQMAIPIFLCIFIGNFLDNKLGTEVLFLIIFTVIGVLAAFRNMYVVGMRYAKKERKDSKKHD